MANRGDKYVVVLEKAHLEWGAHRYTGSRDLIYGEGYIKIPASVAYELNILNLNGTDGDDILGKNLFNCSSADGYFKGVLRAQGNQSDANFAKQFSGDKSLKSIGSWYRSIGATVGDRIEVVWTSPYDIVIQKYK